MTKWILLALLLLGFGLAVFIRPSPAHCTWCPPGPCWGPCGGSDCVCITPPGEMTGKCYGVR